MFVSVLQELSEAEMTALLNMIQRPESPTQAERLDELLRAGLVAVRDDLPVSTAGLLRNTALRTAGLRVPTAARLRCAFWTSPLVHGFRTAAWQLC